MKDFCFLWMILRRSIFVYSETTVSSLSVVKSSISSREKVGTNDTEMKVIIRAINFYIKM